MSQYEQTSYRSFNDFFTRRIRPECRPFDFSPEAFVSPCDAKLSVFPVDEGSRFEIKGFSYSVEELLKDKTLAEKYEGGLCFVFRLGVEDYHRYFISTTASRGKTSLFPGNCTPYSRRRWKSGGCLRRTAANILRCRPSISDW